MPLFFIAILGVYQVLLFFVHVAVYQTIAAAFEWDSQGLAIVFGIMSLSFVIASVFSHRIVHPAVRYFYLLSAYWFGLIHFLFSGAFMFFISELVLFHNNIYVSPALLGSFWFIVFFLIHTLGTWHSSRAQITRITVSLPNLPAAWKNKMVVFVSDVHLGNVWSVGYSRKVVEKIKALKPEAVFVGGDLFDGVRCEPEKLIESWKELTPPLGVFFASGNHEYIEQTAGLLKAIRETKMTILDNEAVDLQGIQLIGVDWKTTHKRPDLERTLRDLKIDPHKPSILLKHEPNNLSAAAHAGISLNLSGHTHAGQLFPLNFIVRRVYKGYHYGLKALDKMMVYTSSGVGSWGPPLRIGTKSEIVAITLN